MRTLYLAGCFLIAATVAAAPRLDAKNPGPFTTVFGSWRVEFENGVKETCDIDTAGIATEKEPLRESKGQGERKDKSFIFKFEDDRLERWTPVGGRMVVEHWFPASQYPEGPRVLGIAERAP